MSLSSTTTQQQQQQQEPPRAGQRPSSRVCRWYKDPGIHGSEGPSRGGGGGQEVGPISFLTPGPMASDTRRHWCRPYTCQCVAFLDQEKNARGLSGGTRGASRHLLDEKKKVSARRKGPDHSAEHVAISDSRTPSVSEASPSEARARERARVPPDRARWLPSLKHAERHGRRLCNAKGGRGNLRLRSSRAAIVRRGARRRLRASCRQGPVRPWHAAQAGGAGTRGTLRSDRRRLRRTGKPTHVDHGSRRCADNCCKASRQAMGVLENIDAVILLRDF
ncbi:unnamed protein product [Lampetra fluviatilis]